MIFNLSKQECKINKKTLSCLYMNLLLISFYTKIKTLDNGKPP